MSHPDPRPAAPGLWALQGRPSGGKATAALRPVRHQHNVQRHDGAGLPGANRICTSRFDAPADIARLLAGMRT
jgi:hypothetical protein